MIRRFWEGRSGNSNTGNVGGNLNLRAFEGKKIIFNNGNSYLILNGDGSFILEETEDQGDGSWIYDSSTNSIVLWPGDSYEYRIWFSDSEPKVGEKIKISHHKGAEIRYDKIVAIQNL